jgi:glycine betaine/choline ABC-type transport system substrate-binding protein
MHGDVCKSVYCHFDGYLDYTGRILLAHYDSTKANQLVARGDNSGVKETLEEMNFYEDREANGEEVNEFLASTPWTIAHSFEEFLEQVEGCCGEYYYVMRDGEWYAGAVYQTEGLIKNGLVLLKDAVAAIEVADVT